MYGVLPTVLSLEGSRRFSASCSSTLPTLPASVIDIVLVPTRGPTMELSMPSLLWPQVRDVRENMSLRQRSFQWFLEKAIEEGSVEFGCVDGEAEEGGRSGGNGAHLGAVVQTRSTERETGGQCAPLFRGSSLPTHLFSALA